MRVIFKKAVPVFLCAFIIGLMLSACGGGNEVKNGSTAADQTPDAQQATVDPANNTDSDPLKAWADQVKEKCGGNTINVAFATHTSTDSFQKIAPEFEKLTGITVRWDVMETDYLKNKQLMDFTGNSHIYDAFMVDGFWMTEYGSKGVIVPLKDYLENSAMTPEWFDFDDILPAYRNGIATYNDEIYGIPTAGETRFVGYRKDLFEKYGKQPPKTLDEMLELAKFFNGKESGLYGMATRGQRGIMFASGWMSIMYNMGGGYIDQKTNKITIDDPKTIQSLQYYIDLCKCAPPDVASYTHEEDTTAFMSGKTAMWLDATAVVPWILDPAKSKIYDKVGLVPTPEGPEGKYSALAGWSLGIPSTSEKKDAAWAFIVYMTSKLNAHDYVDNGGVPTRKSSYQDEDLIAKHPSFPVELEALDAANNLVQKGISWIPKNEKLGQLLERIGYYGSMALSGEMTAEQACKAAQKEVEANMAK